MKAKKSILLFIILTLFGFSAIAAVEGDKSNKGQAKQIEGKVIDYNTGEALTGVKVILSGSNKVTYTDFEGQFQFEDLDKGKYDIEFEYVSYKSNKTSIVLSNNENIANITMELNEL